MTIDWFTFFAQILNFLLLVWLLKRFLYAPIVNAMDQRASAVAAEMDKAIEAQRTAVESKGEYEELVRQFEEQKKQSLADASLAVSEWREEHLQKARCDVDASREQWQQQLSRERHEIIRELREIATMRAVAISDKLLRELASQPLQSQMTQMFLSRLEEDEGPDEVKSSLKRSRNIEIHSSHELTEDSANEIRLALKPIIREDAEVSFTVSDDLVCGIELRTDDSRIAWSVHDSLEEISGKLGEELSHVVSNAANPESRVEQMTEVAEVTA